MTEFENAYYKAMADHIDAYEAGNYYEGDVAAEYAELAAEDHFKATGKKIWDPGYTGSCEFITSKK